MNHSTEAEDLNFDQITEMQWLTGRARRGKGITEPFEGNPVDGFVKRAGDMANYLQEMNTRGLVDESVVRMAQEQLRGMVTMAGSTGECSYMKKHSF
jgi:hypothetical protein